MELVIFLEEPSAANALNTLLPQILPEGVFFRLIPHEGKSDLRRSVPIKLRAWKAPDTRFVILHDQDANKCRQLKQELVELCREAGREDVLVRIACYELEAWYFGDLPAVEEAYPGFKASKYQNKRKYREPDAIPKPSDELKRLIPEFQKGGASRNIPCYMDVEANRSPSFNAFVDGIRRLCG